MARTPRIRTLRRAVGPALVAGLLGACIVISTGPKGNDGGGNFTITMSPTATVNLPRGGTRPETVTVARNGYTGPIALSDSTASGVTGSFNPSSLTGSTTKSVVSITAAVDAALLTQPFVVIATGGGGESRAFVPVMVYSPAVIVSRLGTGTGTVTSNPAGLNCGSTCSATFTATSVTLTATPGSASAFANWSGGCTGTTPTCTMTPSVAGGANSITATFNSTAPAFAMALTSGTVTVAQGASGAGTLNITRVNGFAGAVNLSVSGAPTGLTVTPNPASASGASASIDITAALSLAAGSYPLVITGTGTGVSQQAVPLTVTVTQATGGSSNYAMSFANCDASLFPLWFAVQNNGGAWTHIVGSNSAFTFPVTSTVAVAWVTQNGTNYQTNIRYMSAADVTAPSDVCKGIEQTGTNHLTGTGANLGTPATTYWSITFGGVSAQHDPAEGGSYTLDGAPSGARDLVATRTGIFTGSTLIQKILVRHNVSFANNAAIPLLDFNSTEAILPVNVFATVSNPNSDQGVISVGLATPRGIAADYYETPVSTAAKKRYAALTSGQIQPGDFHLVSIFEGPPTDETQARFIRMLRAAPADETVTLGPTMNSPTFTTLSATTPLRYHADMLSQPEYGAAMQVQYDQFNRKVVLLKTSGFAGGTPTTWGLDIPDMSAAGYSATWGLQSGAAVDWNVIAAGGDFAPFNGAPITADAQMIGGIRGGTLP